MTVLVSPAGNLGDVHSGDILYAQFSTAKADGTPITLAGTPGLGAFRDDNTGGSTGGLTLVVDFGSKTGSHNVKIDTGNAFYTAGHDYQILISPGSVNSISVEGVQVVHFSVDKYGVNVTRWNGTDVPAEDTAGYPKVTVKSGTGAGEVSLTSGEPSSRLSTTGIANAKTAVVAALTTDTYAEPGQGAPPATASIKDKIGYLYKWRRNKKTQTATTLSLFADDQSTVDQKAVVSNDGTTATVAEIGTGP